MLINACSPALNHEEGLMSVEQSIKSKTSQVISSENKVDKMLDHPGNRFKVFDMQITESFFPFSHSLLNSVAINTHQQNYCLGNMASLWVTQNTKNSAK